MISAFQLCVFQALLRVSDFSFPCCISFLIFPAFDSNSFFVRDFDFSFPTLSCIIYDMSSFRQHFMHECLWFQISSFRQLFISVSFWFQISWDFSDFDFSFHGFELHIISDFELWTAFHFWEFLISDFHGFQRFSFQFSSLWAAFHFLFQIFWEFLGVSYFISVFYFSTAFLLNLRGFDFCCLSFPQKIHFWTYLLDKRETDAERTTWK